MFESTNAKRARLISELVDQKRLLTGEITERKRAEFAIAEERRRLHDIIKGANVGTWEFDIATGEIVISDHWAEMLGYTREELSPVTLQKRDELTHPDDLLASFEVLRQHFEGERDYYECELRMRHKEGNWVWILDRGRVHTWSDGGKPLSMSGIHQDVTDRKQAEKKLRESEERYRVLIENQGEGIGIVDQNEVFRFANSAAHRIFGVPSGELVGRNLVEFVVPEDWQATLDQTRKRQAKLRSTYELRIVRPDGARRCLLVTGTPQLDANGVVSGTFGVFRDITDMKRTEEALRLKNSVFDASIAANSIADLDGVITEANDAFLRIWGYPSKAEAIGKPIPYFFNDPDEAVAIVTVLNKTGRWEGDFAAKRKDGSIFIANFQATVLRDQNDKVIGYQSAIIDITDRKRAEEALRESEARLRLSLQAANQGLYDLNVQTGVAIVNREYAQMLGYDPETFIETNASWIERLHPDDRETTAKAYSDYVNGLTSEYRVEFRQEAKEGHWKWILSLGKIVEYDADGKPLRMLGTHTDITDRKRAEEALAESEQKFRTLFENMQEGVVLHQVIYDENGHAINYRILDANQAYEKHTGISPDIARGKLATDLYGTDSPPYLDRWAVVADTGEPNEFETYFEPLQKHFRISAISLAQGTFATVFLDITEQKRQEAAVRESEEKLRSIIRVAPIGIGLVKDRVILTANERLIQMTGYSRDELIGQSARILYPTQEDFEFVGREKYRQISERGTGTVETRWRQKNGSIRYIVLGSTPLDSSDLSKGVTFTALDITDHKQMEEERLELERRLLHSQKLESLGVLAGGIAHDFNNLLTAIIGNLSLVTDDIPELSENHQAIEQAMLAAKRAADLTKQMLAYSGRGHIMVQKLDLNLLVQENVQMLRAVVPKTIALDLQLSQDMQMILVDASQVQQIVMNLIANASDAIGEQAGSITLLTGIEYCSKDYLSRSRTENKPEAGIFAWIEIRDTGHGMDEEVLRRLFEPFFTTKVTGRGLGMSAVLGIVQGHHGAIIVDSIVGKGTNMRVLFPVAHIDKEIISESPQTRSSSKTDAKQPYHSGTILIVDDDEMVRFLCESILRRLGFRTLQAVDGEEAMLIFQDHATEISVVILDLTMPLMDGVTAFKRMMQIRPDVKVILSSGYSEQDAIKGFSGQCPAGFLQKPYEFATLQTEIERVLHNSGAIAVPANPIPS